jgi:GH25 family lysozyme M1 (1,4-beta-N-acetylmuramidase)
VTGNLKRAGLAGSALLIVVGAAAVAGAATVQAFTPAAAVAATAPLVQGTDVSNLTTVTSWPAVRGAGMAFTGVMAFDGATVTNPQYNAQVTGALNAGLYVMPYVVADPLKVSGADQFTVKAWPVIKGVAAAPYAAGGKYLPIALDLEPQPLVTPDPCYGLTAPQMVSWIKAFIAAAQAQPAVPVPAIYTTARWWKKCTGNSTAFGADPLWVADYGVALPALPAGWSGYTFWQSSGSATVAGIAGTGTADLDQLEGLIAGQAGAAGSFQVQTLSSLAGQQVSYTTAQPLPAGVSLSGSGELSWTSAAPAGVFPITVNAASPAVPAAVSVMLRLHGAISVLTAARSTTAGSTVSLRVPASGPDQQAGFPAVLTATGLPTGLSMTPSGLITGWAVKPGTYAVKVAAADSLGGSGSATFTWTVKAAGLSGTTGSIRQGGGTAKCLTDPAGKTANGTQVDLETCTGKADQNWTVDQDGTIRTGPGKTGGKCLDVVKGSTATGARLQLYTCTSKDLAQVWQAGTDGQLVNLKSAKCLDVPVTSARSGTRPVIAPCANSTAKPNEHWVRPAGPIASGEPGKCAAVAGSGLLLASCVGTASRNAAAQHWLAGSDGTLRAEGKCLAESGTSAGALAYVTPCDFLPATKWKLISKNPIAVEIASAASGLCLTAPPSGTQLVLAACKDNPAGTWRLG